MIGTLKNTSTQQIVHKLNSMHIERGETTSGRVLTLLIPCNASDAENAIRTAADASREHPCRIIVLITDSTKASNNTDESNLDAEIRTGNDVSAGEVILLQPYGELLDHLDTLVIPLLVPDTPIVTWWPSTVPENPSLDPLGAMATKRLTDACHSDNPRQSFAKLRATASAKNVDLSWTRNTVWRAMVAAMVDQPPHNPILSVSVAGESGNLSVILLAAWLYTRLNIPVDIEWDDSVTAVRGVTFTREDGVLSLNRPFEDKTELTIPHEQPQQVSMPLRTLTECINEELGQLNPDEIYLQVLHSDFNFDDITSEPYSIRHQNQVK